jgi:hypothetical protein
MDEIMTLAPKNALRDLLMLLPNPRTDLDYLDYMQVPLGAYDSHIFYVPDRHILTQDSLGRYCAALGADASLQGNTFAGMLLHDIFDTAFPKWVGIQLHQHTPIPHSIVMQDKQPNWDNPALISSIKPVSCPIAF